jgi:hypothetical protein
MAENRKLTVNMLAPGEFWMEFDRAAVRASSDRFDTSSPEAIQVRHLEPGAARWIIASSPAGTETTIRVSVDLSADADPNNFTNCNATTAGYWTLDGLPPQVFGTLKGRRQRRGFLTPLEPLRSDETLSYEEVVRLVDESPAWPADLQRRVQGQPFDRQFLSFGICTQCNVGAWQWTGDYLQSGTLMQIFDGTGIATYNSGDNWVDTYGEDQQDGHFTLADGDCFCPDFNGGAFFASSPTHFFAQRNQGLGFGCGIFKGFDPSWARSHRWLLAADDAGEFSTVFNDKYFNDNSDRSFCANVAIKSQKTHFEHVLKTRFGQGR